MNYLIIIPAIGVGGAQRVALNIAYFLKKSGHKALIFTTLLEDDNLSEKFRKLDYIVSKNIILKRGGQTSRYQNINNLFVLLFRLFKIRLEMNAIIIREKIDAVIICQQPFNWIASFYRRCPVVWYCYEPVSLWRSPNKNYFPLRITKPTVVQGLLENLYEQIDRFIVSHGIVKILASSNLTKKLILNIYVRSAIVINPGVEDEWLKTTSLLKFDNHKNKDIYSLDRTFNIIQVGKFNYEKNHLFTIDVFKLFLKTNPKSKLIFVGEGEFKKVIEDKIKRLGLKNSVLLVDSVSDTKLRGFLKRSHVMFYPSIIQTWGLAPLEAIAAGVVPVVSDKCGVAELISKEKIGFVTKLNVQEASKQLFYIYKHQSEVQKMVKNGQRFITNNLNYGLFVRKIQEEIWKSQ